MTKEDSETRKECLETGTSYAGNDLYPHVGSVRRHEPSDRDTYQVHTMSQTMANSD